MEKLQPDGWHGKICSKYVVIQAKPGRVGERASKKNNCVTHTSPRSPLSQEIKGKNTCLCV